MNRHHPLLIWIFIIAIVAAMVAAGLRAGQEYGWTGYVIGGILSLLGAALVLILVVLVGLGWDALRRAGPQWPRCRRQTEACKGDYSWVRLDDGTSVLRCACTAEYAVERDERGRLRVLERLENGSKRAYMVHVRFRGWRPDEGG